MSFFRKQKNNSRNPFVSQGRRIDYGKMKSNNYFDWTEQALAVEGNRNETMGKSFNLVKLPKISLVMIFFILIILLRIVWLQIVKGKYYLDLAEGNRIRVERLEAKRGVIYDRQYRPLARNVANFLLYVTPADLPKDQSAKSKIVNSLSGILGSISPGEIEAILAKVKINSLEAYQPLFIADNIEYDKAMLLNLEADKMPGVALSNKTRREYNLYSLSLSHILGYTGKISDAELKKFGSEYLPIDYIGKTGIENFWENEMRGINGSKQIEVDSLGKEKKIINQTRGEDGHNLVLSLDIIMQSKLEDLVAASLQKLKLNVACAIALDPDNGEILAMVSYPSYNNNAFARGISKEEYEALTANPDKPLFNHCVSGEYPSGSTIKPVIAAAALEEKIINENTIVNSAGGIRVGQWFFPDWKAGGHGATNVKKAIAESVNTFFYYVGGGYNDFTGLGIDRIVRYEKLFNLGVQTGIDLVNEASGFLPTKDWKEKTKKERWYIGDTYHVAIGQGDMLVTPLQVANYTAVFANGGQLYQPHLIRQVLAGDDRLIGQLEVRPVRENFITSDTVRIVRNGMRLTATGGSARSLEAVGVPLAGKTGTAQWSSTKKNHAWFTGFAPFDNPRIVITILIPEGGEGSSTAVPIAKDFLMWYFNDYLRISDTSKQTGR